jgi:multidrug efflux pump subunit AcrA (membrane-fusion protein)
MSILFVEKFHTVATALTLATTVTIFTGCHDPDAGANLQTTSDRDIPQSVPVEQTEIPRVYVSPGSIVSSQEFRVTSTISGFIQEIAVREGDRIKTGDLLVRIDPSKVQRAIAQAEAAVDASQAELEPGAGRVGVDL